MIEIDGSYGEGGGALLRQALGLAAYAGKAVRITRIRERRRPPGLKPQHLEAVRAVAAISDARVEGAGPGSTELTFEPGAVRGRRLDVDIGTAGSVTLVVQALLVPCTLTAGRFDLRLVGGTDVRWSPPADYLARVTLPAVSGLAEFDLRIRRRGYYPKGGGVLELGVRGGDSGPRPLRYVESPRARRVLGVSHAAAALRARRVAERQAEAAHARLQPLGLPVRIETEYADSRGAGSGITLWSEPAAGPAIGGSAIGERGKPAEEVGREAASALVRELSAGAAVDRHLADQLVPFLAVTGGSVRTSEITLHTRSNIYVAERILGVSIEIAGGGVLHG